MNIFRCATALALLATSALVAQKPEQALPESYRLVLDNAEVAVLRVHYGPHQTLPMHDHSAHATVYVYLNDSGPVRFRHADQAQAAELTRPPTHAGAFRVSPGRLERHAVENLSELPSDFLRIELKKFPVHSIAEEFRGPAPAAPLHAGVALPYDTPDLAVERIVCQAHLPCRAPAENAPSVLVAIPAQAPSPEDFASAQGEVTWVPARSVVQVKFADTSESAQFLRIILRRH